VIDLTGEGWFGFVEREKTSRYNMKRFLERFKHQLLFKPFRCGPFWGRFLALFLGQQLGFLVSPGLFLSTFDASPLSGVFLD